MEGRNKEYRKKDTVRQQDAEREYKLSKVKKKQNARRRDDPQTARRRDDHRLHEGEMTT